MISEESKELKTLFIEEELSQHGEWLADVLIDEIEKKRLTRSRDLIDSVNYETFHSGENPGVKVNFLSYGRAFEINGYKRNRKVDSSFAEIWGQKENRSRKKNTRWYAMNMYGGLNRLISRIMYGLSDQEIARLKNILQNRKSI